MYIVFFTPLFVQPGQEYKTVRTIGTYCDSLSVIA